MRSPDDHCIFMSRLGVDDEKFPPSSSLPVSSSGSVSFPVSLHHVVHSVTSRRDACISSGKLRSPCS